MSPSRLQRAYQGWEMTHHNKATKHTHTSTKKYKKRKNVYSKLYQQLLIPGASPPTLRSPLPTRNKLYAPQLTPQPSVKKYFPVLHSPSIPQRGQHTYRTAPTPWIEVGRQMKQASLFGPYEWSTNPDIRFHGHGHRMGRKPKSTYRVLGQNIDNIPLDSDHSKSHHLVARAAGQDTGDIRLWQEIGIDPRNLPPEHQWRKRTEKKRIHTIHAYNKAEDFQCEQQHGGTMVLVSPRLIGRRQAQGTDTHGRWAWFTAGNHNGRAVTFISAYRPCDSQGTSTVYEQQRRTLGKTEDIDPRQRMITDLQTFIQQQHHRNRIVILSIDFNDDVRGHRFQSFLRATDMWDPILQQHGNNCPATCNKNTQNVPIDAIACTKGIVPEACGFSPPREGCASDHLQLWADFDPQSLFGTAHDHSPPEYDRLDPTKPKLVDSYNTKCYDAIKHHLPTIKQLAAIPANEFNYEHHRLYDQVLQDVTRRRLDIKQRLRHFYGGNIPWSPAYQQALNVMLLWRHMLLFRTRFRFRTKPKKKKKTYIRTLMKKTNIMHAFHVPVDQLQRLKIESQQHYRTVTKNAPALRQAFISQLDKDRAARRGTTPHIERHNRLRIEEQRRQGKVARKVRRKIKTPVDKVYYTDNNEKIECTTQSSIWQAASAEGIARFSQTKDTVPMESHVISQIGYFAEKDAVPHILGGTFDDSHIKDPYLRKILQYARMPLVIKQEGILPAEITKEEHIEGWQQQRHTTGSADMELAFTDHMAATYHDGMAEIDRLLREIPFAKNFAPTAFQNMVDFLILKKANVFDVSKMRIITMFNAAFNMNNKKIGRDIMNNAAKYHLMPKEQGGSVKGRRANYSLLEKVLHHDLYRSRRWAYSVISNDAKSCYDRIVLWVAAIALIRMGAPQPAVQTMITSIQRAQHYIHNAFGTSSVAYSNDSDIPLQGCGQGNGAGPVIWAAISAILINIIRDRGYGAQVISRFKTILCHYCGFAYVDDTDLVEGATSPATTGDDISTLTQELLTWWNGLLRATGGALRPDKSFWTLVDFTFHNGSWRYKTISELPATLNVSDAEGTPCVLKCLEACDAEETLGVKVAADGNWTAAAEALKEKAIALANQLRTGYIDKKDAWYVFNHVFARTLEYPMPATSITEAQWNDILKPFFPIFLNKIGIASTFPRALIFTPTRFQGLGICHPYFWQQIIHLEPILAEPNTDSNLGHLINSFAEEIRTEAAWPGPLSSIPSEILTSVVTHGWLRDTLIFFRTNQVTLHDPLPHLALQRQRDRFLMQVFLEDLQYSGDDLYQLRLCMQAKEAISLSDITTMDGKSLRSGALYSPALYRREQPTSESPRVPPRHCLKWTLWNEALRRLCSRSNLLRAPLGDWFPADPSTSPWKWWYSPLYNGTGRLYGKHGHVWREYRQISRATRHSMGRFASVASLSTSFRSNPVDLPKILCKADVVPLHKPGVRLDQYQFKLIGHSTCPPPPPTPLPPNTLTEALDHLHPDSRWAVHDAICHSDTFAVASAITAGTCLAVSDGSYHAG